MLENLNPPTRKHPCKVNTILNELAEKDKAIFADVVMNPAWPVKALSRELAQRGIEISETPIYNHRAKGCSCWKA